MTANQQKSQCHFRKLGISIEVHVKCGLMSEEQMEHAWWPSSGASLTRVEAGLIQLGRAFGWSFFCSSQRAISRCHAFGPIRTTQIKSWMKVCGGARDTPITSAIFVSGGACFSSQLLAEQRG